MTWTKKSAAPDYFNQSAAFLTLATGDSAFEWLIPWIPLALSYRIYKTSDFCALGPPPVAAPLTDVDFVGLIPSNPFTALLALAALRPRLEAIALERIFAGYCENIVTGGSTVVTQLVDVFNTTGLLYFGCAPAGSTSVTVTTVGLISGPNFDYDFQAASDCVGSGLVDAVVRGHNTAPGTALTATWNPSWPGWVFVSINTGQAHVRLDWTVPNAIGTFDFAPPAPTQPPSAIPPSTRSYATIADLGKELDAQESKLDLLVSAVSFLASTTALPPTIAAAPADATAAPLHTPGAIGYRVDVSGVPPGADEHFGPITKFHRVGRVSIGSVNGWLSSIDLEHSPMLIAPLPQGVDTIQVTCYPPATATVTALYPPK